MTTISSSTRSIGLVLQGVLAKPQLLCLLSQLSKVQAPSINCSRLRGVANARRSYAYSRCNEQWLKLSSWALSLALCKLSELSVPFFFFFLLSNARLHIRGCERVHEFHVLLIFPEGWPSCRSLSFHSLPSTSANASKLQDWCLRPIQYLFCAHADRAPPHLFKTYTIDILFLNLNIHGACICETNGNAHMLVATNSEVQRPSTYSSRSACESNGHHRHQFSQEIPRSHFILTYTHHTSSQTCLALCIGLSCPSIGFVRDTVFIPQLISSIKHSRFPVSKTVYWRIQREGEGA